MKSIGIPLGFLVLTVAIGAAWCRSVMVEPNRFVLADWTPGTGWTVLAMLAGTTTYFVWAMLLRIGRRVRDPEWRRSADSWSWMGIGVLAAILLGMAGLAVVVVIANIAWHGMH